MISIAEYDDLLIAIYEAGAGRRALGRMLIGIAQHVDGLAAGFLVYDEASRRIIHGITAPPRTLASDWQQRMGDMNDEAGLRAITRTPLRTAQRFTDIVPRSRLRSAAWFRRQEVLTGVGYGIAIDLEIGGRRVRMFAMRAAGAPDFESGPLELLGRIGRHVERAFSGAAHLLAPDRAGPDAAAIVYHDEGFANARHDDHGPERQLAARYGLTPSEARVVLAAGEGLARAEMAERLGISINSVKTHLRRVHAKLGVRRAGELVRMVGPEIRAAMTNNHPKG